MEQRGVSSTHWRPGLTMLCSWCDVIWIEGCVAVAVAVAVASVRLE